MQAMSDVSEMAQKLISACEDAMVIINCDNTEDDAHVVATAAFDEAASSLGELGFEYEVSACLSQKNGWVFVNPPKPEYGCNWSLGSYVCL
jgi:hypothetical protein